MGRNKYGVLTEGRRRYRDEVKERGRKTINRMVWVSDNVV